MGDREPRAPEIWGIWLILVALVLGLVWRLMYFPIWTTEHEYGLSMRILLTFIEVRPLQYVLERLGPAGWIIGGLGAYLVERARVGLTHIPGAKWNRERIAIGFAIGAEATFFTFSGSIPSTPIGLWLLVAEATGIIVSIALGLFLLWTAERIARVSMRKLGSVAFAFALVAAALDLFTLGRFFGLMDPSLSVDPPATVASALLGAGSLAIWVLIYSLVLRGARNVTPAVPVTAEA